MPAMACLAMYLLLAPGLSADAPPCPLSNDNELQQSFSGQAFSE